jgi:hypothetical protein
MNPRTKIPILSQIFAVTVRRFMLPLSYFTFNVFTPKVLAFALT